MKLLSRSNNCYPTIGGGACGRNGRPQDAIPAFRHGVSRKREKRRGRVWRSRRRRPYDRRESDSREVDPEALLNVEIERFVPRRTGQEPVDGATEKGDGGGCDPNKEHLRQTFERYHFDQLQISVQYETWTFHHEIEKHPAADIETHQETQASLEQCSCFGIAKVGEVCVCFQGLVQL